MIVSDTAVTRPVLASVVALLLVLFGFVAYSELPLREYPDIDPPVVSIETFYPGAAASVIETQITEVIEDAIAGIEGIEFIESRSEDSRSDISIRFSLGRDVDSAANDVRDRISGILADLPVEADPPEIRKVDSNEDVIVWWNLVSDEMSVPELTDYAERFIVDRFSVLDGVARVRIGGAQSYAMRVWLDRSALAARDLTVADVEAALQAENVELPAGNIESTTRLFTARVDRQFRDDADFRRLVVARGGDGYLVRLGDVARVERGTVENRTFFRGNEVPMVGLGIIRQSTANTIEVARATRDEVDRLNAILPDGMQILPSYDSSVFVEGAVDEVYRTLAIAIGLVVLAIFVFLGSLRAVVIPAITVPIALTATFIAVAAFGFTVNLFTLLALVLAIGLLVDDAIIVLENVRRRMDELGETPLVAAYRGVRQVAFAVISTTLVLVAVFVPITFMRGDVGRLFSEFALTMAAAVAFSSFIALTVSPMLCSKLLKSRDAGRAQPIVRATEIGVDVLRRVYQRLLIAMLRVRWLALAGFAALIVGFGLIYTQLSTEYVPREDRGAFQVLVNGPEGASHEYMTAYMTEIERRIMEYVDSGEVSRMLVRTPREVGNIARFNTGIVITVLEHWDNRRPADVIMNEMRDRLADLTGVRIAIIMRQGFGSGFRQPVQFVLAGAADYDELAEWRDIMLDRIAETNPGLTNIDWDYKETQPQLRISIDYDRAAELGVTISNIGRTLESMLGSRRVTTYIEDGEEYDVIIEGERDVQRTPTNLQNIYVRSSRSQALIPLSNLVTIEEVADSFSLNRYNRLRAITLEANLDSGLVLGDALAYLENLAAEHLPDSVIIDYKGESLDFQTAGQSILLVFLLGIVVVFLVLAGQFESWVHPLVIILGVPLAVGGGLLGLWVTGGTLNVYSQIGLIMLVGLAAKNGILIVEFANQLRDAGKAFDEALVEASVIRLRPILMTGITTAAGAVPLILSSGPGAETRAVIGVVVMFGVLTSMVLTLFVIPLLYSLLARNTGAPGDVRKRLEDEAGGHAALQARG